MAFKTNKEYSYDDIILLLSKNHIKFSIDNKQNIILLENNSNLLTFPHKFYITKGLSILIDRYCSFDVYKIVNLLLKLYVLDIIVFCNIGDIYE